MHRARQDRMEVRRVLGVRTLGVRTLEASQLGINHLETSQLGSCRLEASHPVTRRPVTRPPAVSHPAGISLRAAAEHRAVLLLKTRAAVPRKPGKHPETFGA